MRDISSTTFGLLIAFLLPGITGMLAASIWIDPLQDIFATFTTSESNVGLFLMVILFAIAISLQLSLIRWAIFEKWICREIGLKPEDFKNLGDNLILTAYRASVDEHYRYHQFWGSMSIVLPFLFWGLGTLFWSTNVACVTKIAYIVGSIIIELITIYGARQAYINYVNRGRTILKGK